MDTSPLLACMDWRDNLRQDFRTTFVTIIFEELEKFLHASDGKEIREELFRLITEFEEKTYFASGSREQYVGTISSKISKVQTAYYLNNANSSVSPRVQSLHGQPLSTESERLETHPITCSQASASSSPKGTDQCRKRKEMREERNESQKKRSRESIMPPTSTNFGRLISQSVYLVNIQQELWVQESIYQKIKSMRDLYLPVLHEIHRVAVQKIEAMHGLNEVKWKYERLKKLMEQLVEFLSTEKKSITRKHGDKLEICAKRITGVLCMFGIEMEPPKTGNATDDRVMQNHHQQQQQHHNHHPSHLSRVSELLLSPHQINMIWDSCRTTTSI